MDECSNREKDEESTNIRWKNVSNRQERDIESIQHQTKITLMYTFLSPNGYDKSESL